MTDTPAKTSALPELWMRIFSAAVMAVAAIAGVVGGGLFFSLIVAIAACAALREWHRLVHPRQPRHGVSPESLSTGVAVIAALLMAYAQPVIIVPLFILALGGLAAGLSAATRKVPVLWHAAGVAYIGAPALALVTLRQDHAHGGWIVLGLFIAVWAADTGALLFGRAIGGPKLAPGLSPNKTWAGLVGGTLCAGAGEALYVAVLGGDVGNAALFGISLALVGHGGDLFESWVKRRFQAKNTGTMIPGHGGMLDRVDSLLFATPVAAGLVFLAGFDPLTGVPW